MCSCQVGPLLMARGGTRGVCVEQTAAGAWPPHDGLTGSQYIPFAEEHAFDMLRRAGLPIALSSARPKRAGSGARSFNPALQAVVRTLTSAPITPRLVRRRYSKGRVLLMVLRKGYRKSGMCAAPKEVCKIVQLLLHAYLEIKRGELLTKTTS